MIFNLYSRFVIKLGDDERYIFDRTRLMFTEVTEIEKVSGLSYGEWERELGRYSVAAIGPLLHVLRKREGQPSDFATLQFNVAEMDCVPVHDDGTEFTPAEVTADLASRMDDAAAGPGPTRGGEATAVAAEEGLPDMTITSPSSPPVTASGHSNGTSSRGPTSSSSRRTRTPG